MEEPVKQVSYNQDKPLHKITYHQDKPLVIKGTILEPIIENGAKKLADHFDKLILEQLENGI